MDGPRRVSTELTAGHVVLAPGSVPMDIDAAPVSNEGIVDSTGALEFESYRSNLESSVRHHWA
ncbi:MAG: hypothetical protein Ct9H300mP8_10480 [Gammaproteobacteria bacterium]|nr:MAG: hypothetical protein Ct9H300mP8_10480 [Gammaproteobacteria bacterium]